MATNRTDRTNGTAWLRGQAQQAVTDAKLAVSTAVAGAVEVEAWLQSHEVAYAPPTDIPMSAIDTKRSRVNQARPQAIVSETVERFMGLVRQGSEPPPIVVYPSGQSMVTIVDGNTRHESLLKLHRDSICGIVVSEETSSELIQLLTVEANTRHGVTPDTSWRMDQAFHLVALGYTVEQAAEAAAVSKGQLQLARQVRAADARARSMKLTGFTDLPASSRVAVGALRDDQVFYQAAHLAMRAALTTDQVREIVRDVKKLPSESARLLRLAEIGDSYALEAATKVAMGRTSSRVTSAKHSLVTGIGKVMAVDAAVLQRSVLTAGDRDALLHRLGLLADKWEQLQSALEQMKFEDEEPHS